MLNKIWAALIITSILFALIRDIMDEINNPYQNGIPQNIPYTVLKHDTQQLVLGFLTHQPDDKDLIDINAIIETDSRIKLYIDSNSPQWLQLLASVHGNGSNFTATLIEQNAEHMHILFPELHWVKLRAITEAAFDMAEFAAKLALGLIGLMALWLGLMRIAEQSGIIQSMVKIVQPLLRWLFPGIPKDHPAFASISMNMAANVLGLGNAATPLGIKAMQQLQQLNNKSDTASDEMCMFLALNTSSVQLLPPVTLIALMGTQISDLIIPIILATTCSTITAIIVVRLYQKGRLRCNN